MDGSREGDQGTRRSEEGGRTLRYHPEVSLRRKLYDKWFWNSEL